MRIAVVGTYRSGSSALAGILHFLGVDMGGPFWGEHFESNELSAALRRWWSEPRLVAAMASEARITHLREWIMARERTSQRVGAKHPLLSLSCQDLLDAWGGDTQFIWCLRPIEQSVESLARMRWWEHPERIQRTLHDANEGFFQNHPCLRVHFEETLADPRQQVERVADALALEPTDDQVSAAVRWIDARRSAVRAVSGGPALATKRREPTRPARRESKIVATVLSGNSESIVGEAVASVVDWVDEVYLIDTGITDSTADRVAELARDKFSRRSFAWCNDFSSARNAALKISDEAHATWALTVDTDERFAFTDFEDREHLRRTLDSNEQIQAWMVAARDGSYSKERFIRIPSSLQWRGRTHEALIGAAEGRRRLLSGCHFWETPKSKADYQRKLERDLQVLLEETASQPLNPRWWYYLGQTYEGMKQYREATKALDRCVRLDGWPEESAWACYTAARCLSALHEYREAEEFCALGMTRKPTTPELPWLAGWCCFQRSAIGEAIAWSRVAALLGHSKDLAHAAIFRHVPAWYEAPYDVLRYAYRQMGADAEASQAERDFQREKALRQRDHRSAT